MLHDRLVNVFRPTLECFRTAVSDNDAGNLLQRFAEERQVKTFRSNAEYQLRQVGD